ncbi:MAG: M48 family metallopeptidase [Clostridium sartagoforme]|nr:M48 family metallopeptidase [Clostridium sartagoforme]
MKRAININNNKINYNLILKDKKNISIKLDANGELIVSAPIDISISYIEKLLIKKQNWILSNINKIKNSNINNENKILFLGRVFSIKIELSNDESVYIDGDFIIIKSNNIDTDYVKFKLSNWLKDQANIIVMKRTKDLSINYGLFPSKIIIKNQKSRWGSCNTKQEVRLNWRLVLMPYHVMDYIITHELCHLVHMNHGREFWNLVYSYNSNYKESKKWLRENAFSLLKIN